MKSPKYPDVTVDLIGNNGNAFAILGQVTKALRHANIDPDEIKQFQTEAMSGDYDKLLQTCMKWVEIE